MSGAAILWAVAWVLLALAALILLALILPTRLEMHLSADQGWRATATLRPLGRFGPPIRLRRTSRPQASKPERPDKPARKTRRATGNIAPAALRLVTDLASCVRFDRLRVRATFGCADPADTGTLYGQLIPLAQIAQGWPVADIRLHPAFDREALDVTADLTLSARLITLVRPAIRFGWAMIRARG